MTFVSTSKLKTLSIYENSRFLLTYLRAEKVNYDAIDQIIDFFVDSGDTKILTFSILELIFVDITDNETIESYKLLEKATKKRHYRKLLFGLVKKYRYEMFKRDILESFNSKPRNKSVEKSNNFVEKSRSIQGSRFQSLFNPKNYHKKTSSIILLFDQIKLKDLRAKSIQGLDELNAEIDLRNRLLQTSIYLCLHRQTTLPKPLLIWNLSTTTEKIDAADFWDEFVYSSYKNRLVVNHHGISIDEILFDEALFLVLKNLDPKQNTQLRTLSKSFKTKIDKSTYWYSVSPPPTKWCDSFKLCCTPFQYFYLRTRQCVPVFQVSTVVDDTLDTETGVVSTSLNNYPVFLYLNFPRCRIYHFSTTINFERNIDKDRFDEELAQFTSNYYITAIIRSDEEIVIGGKKDKMIIGSKINPENTISLISPLKLDQEQRKKLLSLEKEKARKMLDKLSRKQPMTVFDIENMVVHQTYFFDIKYRTRPEKVFKDYLWKIIFS